MTKLDRNREEWEAQLRRVQGRRKGFKDFDTQFFPIPRTRATVVLGCVLLGIFAIATAVEVLSVLFH